MSMNLVINNFEGPLDLLLHLIKINKMDIYNINIGLITKEYLKYINNNDLSIDGYSEYLVMATELIQMKSRMLLHKNFSEDEKEDEINPDELQRRLLEYQKIKDIAQNFKTMEFKRNEIYTRVPSDFKQYRSEHPIINTTVTLEELLSTFQDFLNRKKEEEPRETTVTKKELSVAERISAIRNILHNKKRIKFLELFDDLSKAYVIVTFLSILDMAKNKEIVIKQDKNFCDIYIEMSEGH